MQRGQEKITVALHTAKPFEQDLGINDPLAHGMQIIIATKKIGSDSRVQSHLAPFAKGLQAEWGKSCRVVLLTVEKRSIMQKIGLF